MNKTILTASLVALGLAGAAYAAEIPGGADPLGDKVLTKAEFQAKGAQMFDMMDANKDGKLDQADRAAHEGQMFTQADTNKDGVISKDEFDAAHQRGPEGQPGAAGGMARGGQGGKHMGGRPGGEHRMGMMMLQMADTNKDGAVSRDEFLAAHTKHFDAMDTNHDGKLTKEERKAAHDKMRAMGGKRGGKMGDHKMGDHQMGDMPPPPPPAN